MKSVLSIGAMTTETRITRKQAVAAYGGVASLAKALGISRAAVYLWPENDPIPELQALRLRYELKPETFGASAGQPPARRTTAAAGETAKAAQAVLTSEKKRAA